MNKTITVIILILLVVFLVGCAKKTTDQAPSQGTGKSGQTAIDQDVSELDNVDKDLGDNSLEDVEKDLDFGL